MSLSSAAAPREMTKYVVERSPGLEPGLDVDKTDFLSPASMEFLVNVITLGAEATMVFGGVVPYVPQYLAIKRSNNTKGFSLYVCLALVVANTLRILFWFGRHFEYPLLLQSVLMNITMLELVRLCVQVNNKTLKDPLIGVTREKRIFIDFELKHFWQWTDFQSYVEAVMTFLATGCVIMFFMLKVDPFVETVGFLAVFTEALLGTPQFYKNFKNKSTYGMSLHMVMMWTCGDIYKTTYFLLRQTPLQFVICGALQIGVDVAILGQVWFYRHNTAKKKKSDLNTHY